MPQREILRQTQFFPHFGGRVLRFAFVESARFDEIEVIHQILQFLAQTAHFAQHMFPSGFGSLFWYPRYINVLSIAHFLDQNFPALHIKQNSVIARPQTAVLQLCQCSQYTPVTK